MRCCKTDADCVVSQGATGGEQTVSSARQPPGGLQKWPAGAQDPDRGSAVMAIVIGLLCDVQARHMIATGTSRVRDN